MYIFSSWYFRVSESVGNLKFPDIGSLILYQVFSVEVVSLSDTLKHFIASFTSHSANTDFSFLSSPTFVPLAYLNCILN